MNVLHAIRNAPDWLKLQNEKAYDEHVFNNFVKNKMKKVFNLWSTNISPNYFVFRNKFTKIARKNHLSLSVDKFFESALNIEKKLVIESQPFLILFSDDDDWYNNQVVDIIKNIYKKNLNIDAILWNHAAFLSNYKQFDKNHNKPYIVCEKKINFFTNNYALTDKFFKKLNIKDFNYLNYGIEYEPFYGHCNLKKFFMNKMKIIKIPDWLSMSHKSICSYSFWLKNDSFEDIKKVVNNYKYKVTNNLNIENKFNWAKDYIQEVIKLYKNLKLNEKFL